MYAYNFFARGIAKRLRFPTVLSAAWGALLEAKLAEQLRFRSVACKHTNIKACKRVSM